MPKLAYSYLRFSTPEQSQGDSFRRQKTKALEYAETHDLKLAPLSFNDLGVSAYRGNNRDAALGAFVAAVEGGKIKPGCFLLVESLDRLSRDYAIDALGQLKEIVSLGVTVVTLVDGREYTEKALREDSMSLMISLKGNRHCVELGHRGTGGGRSLWGPVPLSGQ